MNRERDAHDAYPATLAGASGRRLSNQIGRAFRRTFGAEAGLRMLMRSIAAQMLAAGATEAAVRQAFESAVMHHPARTGRDASSLVTGKSHSDALVEIANECVTAVARSEAHVPDAGDSGH